MMERAKSASCFSVCRPTPPLPVDWAMHRIGTEKALPFLGRTFLFLVEMAQPTSCFAVCRPTPPFRSPGPCPARRSTGVARFTDMLVEFDSLIPFIEIKIGLLAYFYFYGGDGESRTRVRKHFRETFSERSQ